MTTNDTSGGGDPVAAARRDSAQALRRRFYEVATVLPTDAGFAVCLDGKPVRTPAGRALAAPNQSLAEAMAAEWRAQETVIVPAKMPLTRLANSVIDGVAPAPAPVAAEIEKYLASDLLCYRAGEPAQLRERQAKAWDPILDWARDALGAAFAVGDGVVHVSQPQSALAAAARHIPSDPWRLGALHSATTLTGSALLGLALLSGRLSADAAWEAAHVDEDWNMQQWGRDDIALSRRAARFAELQAAAAALAV